MATLSSVTSSVVSIRYATNKPPVKSMMGNSWDDMQYHSPTFTSPIECREYTDLTQTPTTNTRKRGERGILSSHNAVFLLRNKVTRWAKSFILHLEYVSLAID